ncbi:MAG: GNAT family N-acetyltransferase [Candidatus Hodarchaeota archaeon]
MIELDIRYLEESQISEIIELIKRIFDEFEAPEYSEEGIQEFYSYITPEGFKERLEKNHFTLVAMVKDRLAGVIEIRDNNHICLLFVDKQYHKKSIAKRLLEEAISIAKSNQTVEFSIDVNSSPYAVEIYKKMGFLPTDNEQLVNGIRFIPMSRRIE